MTFVLPLKYDKKIKHALIKNGDFLPAMFYIFTDSKWNVCASTRIHARYSIIVLWILNQSINKMNDLNYKDYVITNMLPSNRDLTI